MCSGSGGGAAFPKERLVLVVQADDRRGKSAPLLGMSRQGPEEQKARRRRVKDKLRDVLQETFAFEMFGPDKVAPEGQEEEEERSSRLLSSALRRLFVGKQRPCEFWVLSLSDAGLIGAAEAEGLPPSGWRGERGRLASTPDGPRESHAGACEAGSCGPSAGWASEDSAVAPASAEVLTLLRARAYHPRTPEGVQELFPEFQGGPLGGCSLLALAEHIGCVTAVAGLHASSAEEMREQFPNLLRPWPWAWKRSAVNDIDRIGNYLGIPTAEYFLFVHDYAEWLFVPTILGLATVVMPPWSSHVFMVLTSIWSTMFIEHWKRSRSDLGHRLLGRGRGPQRPRQLHLDAPVDFQMEQQQILWPPNKKADPTKKGTKPSSEDRKPSQQVEEVEMTGSCHSMACSTHEVTTSPHGVMGSAGTARPRKSQGGQSTGHDPAGGLGKTLPKDAIKGAETAFKAIQYLYGHLLKAVIPMCGVVAMVVLVISLLLWIEEIANRLTPFRRGSLLLRHMPGIWYAVVAGYLENFYEWMVAALTSKQEFLSYLEYRKSTISLVALFQLANYLGWFLYVALWRQDIEFLQWQLFICLTVKQAKALLLELLVPALRSLLPKLNKKLECWLGSSKSPTQDEMKRAKLEEQMSLMPPDLEGEYLQLAIVFTVTNAFAVVFPLGPFFALLHAYLSRWGDARKLLMFSRRAAPSYVDAGVSEAWLGILEAVSMATVMVNIAVVAVSSGWTTRQLVVVEHLLLILKAYTAWSIPDESPDVHADNIRCEEERLYPTAAPRSRSCNGSACTSV